MDSCRFTMSILGLILCLALLGLSEGNVLHIKHAPPYMVLKDASKTKLSSSNLPSELAAALGVKNIKSSDAFKAKSMLRRPAANFLVTLLTSDGHDVSLSSQAKFPLEWDAPYIDVQQLMSSVQKTFQSQDPLMFNFFSKDELFDMDSSKPIFKSIPSSLQFAKERLLGPDSILTVNPSINSSHKADSRLLAELQTMKDVVSTLKSNPDTTKTNTPDLLSFTLTGLKAVGDSHGITSQQTRDAEKLVSHTIDQLTEDLKKVYGGNVMVEVIVTPDNHKRLVRHVRSVTASPSNLQAQASTSNQEDRSGINLALDWYPDFPAAFNIVLWLMIILILVVIFTSYGMWNMNPNLESILYRVPQDESKKNN